MVRLEGSRNGLPAKDVRAMTGFMEEAALELDTVKGWQPGAGLERQQVQVDLLNSVLSLGRRAGLELQA